MKFNPGSKLFQMLLRAGYFAGLRTGALPGKAKPAPHPRRRRTGLAIGPGTYEAHDRLVGNMLRGNLAAAAIARHELVSIAGCKVEPRLDRKLARLLSVEAYLATIPK